MPQHNMAKRATLAVRNLLATTGRSARHDRPDHHDPDTRQLSGRAVAAAPADAGVKATRVIAGALALGLALMTPLAFGSAAYGTSGDTDCQTKTLKDNPDTWTSDGSYVTVTVKAGPIVKTYSDVSAGQVLGPIKREGDDRPVGINSVTTCAVVEVTTTTEAPTTTLTEDTTTTITPEEVTTTTRVSEEVTTTTVAEEVTTTTAAPDEATTTTVPIDCPHDLELIDGRCVSPSITLDAECWVDGVATVVITNHRDAATRPRGIPVEWSYNGSAPVEVVVPPLGTVEVEVTGGPVGGTFTVTWDRGNQWRSIVLTEEDCTVVTTTTIPDEETTTTIPDEETTTTIPDEETTTTIPDEETTTTIAGEVTTTTEPFTVPETTVPGTPDPDPDPVRPVVNPRTSSESLPFTGSQHLQLLGLIGIVALAAGFGMIQLVNRNR